MVSNRANAICLLKVLQEYSDENHILSMREIKEKLKNSYDITIDRRTVYSTVELLQQLDYDISTYEENGIGYYLRTRDFEPAEIRLLTDAVYAFDYISPKQTKDLAGKLQNLLSVHMRRQYRHLRVIRPERKTKNPQVFLNIELLDEAIGSGKKVAFTYLDYAPDKTLQPRRKEQYGANPYGMVCENERYYLVLILEGLTAPSLYRIDLMRDLEILPQKVSPTAAEAELNNTKNVTYAFTGEPEYIRLRCADHVLRHVLDRFGTDLFVQNNKDGTVDIGFTASPQGVKFWALQYLPYVEVLEPLHLRESVIESVRRNPYGVGQEGENQNVK